jgi:hypothetical protein
MEAFPNYGSTLSNAKKTQILLIVSNLSTVEILKMKMLPPLCKVVSSLNRKINTLTSGLLVYDDTPQ